MARGCLSRGTRPIPRVVPKLAVDCDRVARPYSLPKRCYARMDAGRARTSDVQIAWKCGSSKRDLRKMGRRPAAVVGRLAGVSGRRENERARDDAAQRGVSQETQHVSVGVREFV